MSKRENPQGPTFPYLDPAVAVTNPAAMKYQQSALDRLKYKPEEQGGPPVPRLDQAFVPGTTMADQARAQRQPPRGSLESLGLGQAQASFPPAPQQPGILPGDLLPETATRDPQFRQGVGAMFASNQPELARKHGVVRNQQFIPAAQLQTDPGKLGMKTVEGLKEVLEFNAQRNKVPEVAEDEQIRKDSEAGLGGAAARTASPMGSTNTKVTQEDLQRAASRMDQFDLNEFREMMLRDLINNEDQRKMVEDRLAPLSLNDLIMEGHVKQKVIIREGEYEPTFISFDAEEDLKLKELIAREMKTGEAADRYYLDKYSIMSIVLGTVALNGTSFGTHRDENNNFDEVRFWAKYNRMLKLPFHLMASLGVHWAWFDQRVRRLVQATNLKNG